MSALEDAFRQAISDLEDLNRTYALVGGFAVGVRANPRLTMDVDLVVAVDGDNDAEHVTRQLVTAGYVIDTTVEDATTGRLATVRLRSSRDGGVLVDLLFATTGIECEIAGAAEPLTVLPGLEVPVAAVGHLIAMKLLARDDRHRPADADDLRHLSAMATEPDWLLARSAIEQMHERGTNRTRDLRAALADLRSATD